MKTLDDLIRDINGVIHVKMSDDNVEAVMAYLRKLDKNAEAVVEAFCGQKKMPRDLIVLNALKDIAAERKSKDAVKSEWEYNAALAAKYYRRPPEWEALYAQVSDTIGKYHTSDTARWDVDAGGKRGLSIFRNGLYKRYYRSRGEFPVIVLFCHYVEDKIFASLNCGARREMDYMRYFAAALARCRETWGITEPLPAPIYNGEFDDVLKSVDDVIGWRKAVA